MNKLKVMLFSSCWLQKFNGGFFNVKLYIVRLDYQSSTTANPINVPPFFKPFQYFSDIIAGVKFGTLWQHLNNMKSIRISCDHYHQFG
jgi:hypothetical protein